MLLTGGAAALPQLAMQLGVLTQVVWKAITHNGEAAAPLPWVMTMALSSPATLAPVVLVGQVAETVGAVLCMARWVSVLTRMLSPMSIWLLEAAVVCAMVGPMTMLLAPDDMLLVRPRMMLLDAAIRWPVL